MKMIYKRGRAYLFILLMIFSVSSCDLFDLDVNTDPNNPAQASLELLLTNAQLEGIRTFAGPLNDATMGFVGLTSSTDDFNMNNGTWNNTWNFLYSGPLTDLNRIIVAAEEQGNNPHYLGIAQVMKAYYFSLMVDLWSDVPYSEAFGGDNGNKAPAFDDGKAIYDNLFVLIDNAIANFALASPVDVNGDLIYGGNVAQWTKAANSLKLRLLVQARHAYPNAPADVQALVNANAASIAGGDDGIFINSADDDFLFTFGRLQNPDDRHPMYQLGYAGGEAGYSYFGHQVMAEMLAARDPRTPFYFKRQTATLLDAADPTQKQTIPCSQRADCFYNYFPTSNVVSNMVFGKTASNLTESEAVYLSGFFGRDRSDPSGVPNDNPIRTTVGAYPAGGLFDDEAEAGGNNKGSGDGIFPMITSWMVKFYLLEATLTMGVTLDETEADLLEAAIDEQLTKVYEVGENADADVLAQADWGDYDWPLTYQTKNNFVTSVGTNYPAGTPTQRLNYVLKQAWFANFGNGYEIYSAFRRTGLPNNLQAPLQLPRQFALRMPYTQDELNLNPNTPTVVYDSPNDAVFWDVIKFQF